MKTAGWGVSEASTTQPCPVSQIMTQTTGQTPPHIYNSAMVISGFIQAAKLIFLVEIKRNTHASTMLAALYIAVSRVVETAIQIKEKGV